jgi:hypothetical protein
MHLVVVKLEQVQTQLGYSQLELEPVPHLPELLARTLAPVEKLVLQLQVPEQLEEVLLVQHLRFRLTQDVRQREQLYLLQHRLQEEFLQLVKESLYRPYL